MSRANREHRSHRVTLARVIAATFGVPGTGARAARLYAAPIVGVSDRDAITILPEAAPDGAYTLSSIGSGMSVVRESYQRVRIEPGRAQPK